MNAPLALFTIVMLFGTKFIPIVSIFVNDICNASVLNKLASNGVKLVALRCAGFNNVDIKEA